MIHAGLFNYLFSSNISPRFCEQAENIAYYRALNFTTKGTEDYTKNMKVTVILAQICSMGLCGCISAQAEQ